MLLKRVDLFHLPYGIEFSIFPIMKFCHIWQFRDITQTFGGNKQSRIAFQKTLLMAFLRPYCHLERHRCLNVFELAIIKFRQGICCESQNLAPLSDNFIDRISKATYANRDNVSAPYVFECRLLQ